MKLGLVILSAACLACLIPSALSHKLLTAKAVASQAAEDIVSIGENTIAAEKDAVAKAASDIGSIASQAVALKGNVLKKAAVSMAGAAFNGAASIGASIAKAGINMIAAKFSAKPILVHEPSTIVVQTPVLQDTIVEKTVVQEPVVVEYDQAIQTAPISTLSVDVRPQVWEIPAPPQLSQSLWTVNGAKPSFEIVGPAYSPYVYENVQTPHVYGPLIKAFKFGKKMKTIHH